MRRSDEDRWLAINYGPEPLRRKLFALHAFHAELKRIPVLVSEPMIGEIRLQWFRDALGELRSGKPPRQHLVIEELSESGAFAPDFAQFIDGAIDAAAHPLYGDGFADIEAFIGWLKQSDGAMDAAAAKMAGCEPSLLETVKEAGAVFAAARYGTVLAPNLAEALTPFVAECWQELRSKLGTTLPGAMPALGHCFLTPAYLKRAMTPFPIIKRLILLRTIALGK